MTGKDMPRVRAVLDHPLFQEAARGIALAERERPFCGHGLGHLLDVARIAWILNLERELGLGRETVYAAALLHDIGRAEQYARGVAHDEAGGQLAERILGTVDADTGFPPAEREAIVAAVRGHRGRHGREPEPVSAPSAGGAASAGGSLEGGAPPADALTRLIGEADRASRACFACAARADCYWPDGEKNLELRI